MTKETVRIDSSGAGMAEALGTAVRFGEEASLGKQSGIRLRLLAEELIGLLRGITGNIPADFTIEREGKSFCLKLKGEVPMDKHIREELLKAASAHQNSAAKGFMGQIRDMISAMVLPGTLGNTVISGMSMGLISMGSPAAGLDYTTGAEPYMWSMEKYISSVQENDRNQVHADFERSIVANIADEVKVYIQSSSVEVVIFKKFDD